MKRVFKKNQVIIAALAVMIAAAGYLNYSGRLFPDKAKSSEIGSEVASQELLDISQEDSQSASSDIKSQAAAETMLSAKGFTDSVVSLSEESADVVVNAKELSEANRAQIEDIVIRKTGMAAENIVITPAGSKK